MPSVRSVQQLDVNIIHYPITNDLSAYDSSFFTINRRHIYALMGWGAINSGNFFLWIYFKANDWSSFFLMNSIWGLINALIAYFLFQHTIAVTKKQPNLIRRIILQGHVEKHMLLNVGLDLFYITTGLFLWAWSLGTMVNRPMIWWGLGWAVVLQGGYLFLQDLTVYACYRINFKKLKPYLDLFR